MITFKPIVVPSNKRKDGSFLVSIRVYFAGACRRLPTNIVCSPGDLTRSLRIKNKDVLAAAEAIASRYRGLVAGWTDGDLAGKGVDWVVAQIRAAETRATFHLDFFAFAAEYIAGKTPGSRGQYVTACRTFATFLERDAIDVNDITRPLLVAFLAWLPGKAFSFQSGRVLASKRVRIPGGAESRAMTKLAHIYARAQERYNDEDAGVILIPRSPFRGLIPRHPPSRGQRSLGVDLMQTVIDARHPLPTVQAALDVFVLSFALMGANLADLYEARDVGPVWVYHRRKTRTRRADGAEMRVVVPDVVADRIGAGPGWFLPALHRLAGKPEYATAKVNAGLARWCADAGVPTFTFYAARHTWATLARKVGVEKATIDECLCHVGDFRVTDIYIERDWDLIDAANRRVLDLFTFSRQPADKTVYNFGAGYISRC